jgi:hypothetical protein
MKRNLLIAVLLFVTGGYFLDKTENETLGALILLGTLFWVTYFLIIRPAINFVKNIFKKEPAVGKKEVGDAKQEVSTDSVDLKDKTTKTRVQTTNEQIAHGTGEGNMEYLNPQHKLLFISISKSLKIAEIYDAARFAWKLNVERARGVDYVLAHQAGKVIGVFVATEWLPATDPAFSSLNAQADPARWGFIGHVAPSEILLLYFGKQIPADLRKKGASNPIRFLDNTEDIDADKEDGTGATTDAATTEQTGTLGSISIDLALENVVGTVDQDGDFSANGMLQTEQFANKGDQLFIKSKVWATSNGLQLTAINESSDEAYAGDGLTLWTSYEKISIDDGVNFVLNAQLDAYVIDTSETIVIDTSSEVRSIELSGISVRINKFEIDDDGDYRMHYSVFTSAPTVAAVRYASESDAEMQGYFQEFLEPEESRDDYIYGVAKGERIKVELVKMKPLISNLLVTSTGVVSVLEPAEDEDFEAESSEEESNELTKFFAAVKVADIALDDDLALDAKKNALLLLSSQLFESIRDNVDFESRFFFKGKDGHIKDLNDDINLEEILSNSEVEHILKREFLEYFCLVKGNNHWHKSFLRVSEDLSTTLLVCGWNHSVGAIAVQGYSEGDFDTGIVCDPDQLELYTGDAVLERFSLAEADFEVVNYQLKPERVFRIVIASGDTILVNMVYAEIGDTDYEVLGAFSASNGGGGLFYQGKEGEMSVSDNPEDLSGSIPLKNRISLFEQLERLRSEFEEYDDDGILTGLSKEGAKFLALGKADEEGYIEVYSEGASEDFIYDIQDEWNLNFQKN